MKRDITNVSYLMVISCN